MKRWIIILLLQAVALFAFAAGPDLRANPETPERILVMLHLPPPHFRADANYAGTYADESGHAARRRIAAELAAAHGLRLGEDWPMPILGVDCYVMEIVDGQPASKVIEVLSHDPRVEWAQPMATFHGLSDGNTLYKAQPSAKIWHLDELHQMASGRNVRIAIVDSGVDEHHPELAGQIALKENFVADSSYVPEPHGTGVAGIIAARADNQAGILGVAPNARLLALRACRESGAETASCDTFSLGKALQFAILHNANVINLSLTGPSDRLLQKLLDEALRRGIDIVGAADPRDPDGGFPANYPGVLAVTDHERGNGLKAVAAPGSDVPTTAVGGGWRFVSGSSYAAAHVSGLVAMLQELQPGAHMSGLLWKTPAQADGMLDACTIMRRTAGNRSCSCGEIHSAKAGSYR